MAQIERTTTGSVDGKTVTLQSVLDSETDESLSVDVRLSTSGLTQDINIALVIDESGSTDDPSGSDLDGDGDIESVLEAQVLAAQTLFKQMLDAGYTADEVEITLIAYDGNARTIGTYNMDNQSAFDAALSGLRSGGSTNFDAALDEVIDAWDATRTDGDPTNDVDNMDTNHIVFMSDGFSNGSTNFDNELDTIQNTYNGSISAIGVGAASSLDDLDLLDTTSGATQITDLSQLSDAIISPPPPLSDLAQVEVVIDGVTYATYTPGDGALVQSPLGFTLKDVEITGFPFTPGDTIDVDIVATFENGESVSTSHDVLMTGMVCFGPGTRIMTPKGPRRIELLKAGDAVLTLDGGARVLRWVGKTAVSASVLRSQPRMRPIRIAKGALGPGRPSRPLWLSQQHKVLVEGPDIALNFGLDDGALVPAKCLVNGATVQITTPQSGFTYYHLALDRHELVASEGLLTESLQPHAPAIVGLPAAEREELLALFPDLAPHRDDVLVYSRAARPVLRAFEARLIARPEQVSRLVRTRRWTGWLRDLWQRAIERLRAGRIPGSPLSAGPVPICLPRPSEGSRHHRHQP